MKRFLVIAISLLGLAVTLDAKDEVSMGSVDSTYVRPPAVAGAFYPGSPSELVKMMADFFHNAHKPLISSKPLF